ncbi:MAG: transcription initiation factor IIB [Nitrosotalea sp.]
MWNQIKPTNFETTNCTSCRGKIVLDSDRGEKICSSCGIVINTTYFDETGCRDITSTSVENSSLVEPTSLIMYDIGLPTLIDKKNVDVNGKQIESYTGMERLRRLNKFTISNDSKTRNLNKAIREIRRITQILGMSSLIAERSSYIYKKALNRKLIRGRSITGIVAATIYIACKDAGVLFPIDRIEALLENCNKKNVIHYYKLLLRQMKMNIGVPEPSKHVSRIAVRARLSGKTERRALEILLQIEGDPRLSGKKPISLAAAALYLAALQIGEHTTQLRIAIAGELTTTTIRKRYMEIAQIVKQRLGLDLLPQKEILEELNPDQEPTNSVEVVQLVRSS